MKKAYTQHKSNAKQRDIDGDASTLNLDSLTAITSPSHKDTNMITAKELLKIKLTGNSTLEDIFDIYEGEGQFCDAIQGENYHEACDKFYEELAQKIIDLVKE